jgi:hypothetical protein
VARIQRGESKHPLAEESKESVPVTKSPSQRMNGMRALCNKSTVVDKELIQVTMISPWVLS